MRRIVRWAYRAALRFEQRGDRERVAEARQLARTAVREVYRLESQHD